MTNIVNFPPRKAETDEADAYDFVAAMTDAEIDSYVAQMYQDQVDKEVADKVSKAFSAGWAAGTIFGMFWLVAMVQFINWL